MLHPLAIVAVAVLVLNDHVLKSVAPGWVTGKLSDLAGLTYFPLLLATMLSPLVRRPGVTATGIERRMVLFAVVVTGIVFTLVKTVPAAAGVWSWALGLGQWIVFLGWSSGLAPVPVVAPVDPTDLVALPVLAVPAWLALRRSRASSSRSVLAGRAARSRFAGAAFALAAAVATAATQPTIHGTTVVVSEMVDVSRDGPAAVRRVAWSLAPDPDVDVRSVRLSVETSLGSEYLLVPDDPAFDRPIAGPRKFDPFLDLTSECTDGCAGSARVLVRAWDPTASEFGFDIELEVECSGRTCDGDVRLVDDANAALTGDLARLAAGPVGVPLELDRGKRVSAEILLDVDGPALREPYRDLQATLLTGVRLVDVKSGRPQEAAISVGDLPSFQGIDVVTEIDLLRLCEPEIECEIPLSVEMVDVPSGSPEGGDERDYFEFWVSVTIQALDERALPPDALRIEAAPLDGSQRSPGT